MYSPLHPYALGVSRVTGFRPRRGAVRSRAPHARGGSAHSLRRRAGVILYSPCYVSRPPHALAAASYRMSETHETVSLAPGENVPFSGAVFSTSHFALDSSGAVTVLEPAVCTRSQSRVR